MHFCLWSNWFRENPYNGKCQLYILLIFRLRFFFLQGGMSTEIFSTSLFFSQAGPNGATKENWGVNYRALSDLFSISQSRKSSIMYEIGVQMVEIYNEQVRDLLSSDGTQKKYPFTSTCASAKCKNKNSNWATP